MQDIFAMNLACMFLLTIKLPNIKVSTMLLLLFFFYDIFMVFISPLIFKQSVMVEVAAAGAGGHARETVSQDGLTCDRAEGERMPILLMFPRFDYFGGYAML